jgi:hypothetical protein
MDERVALRTFLADQTLAAVESGLWYFAEGVVTDQRIPPWSLYQFEAGWSELAADVILAQPSSGLVGTAYLEGLCWIKQIAAVLGQRGAELPATQMNRAGQVQWGVPFAQYPPRASVSILVDVHTLGGQARRYRQIVEAHELRVNRIVALIDRGPRPTAHVDGIPFARVLHLPLSLYRRARDVSRQPSGGALRRVGLLAS